MSDDVFIFVIRAENFVHVVSEEASAEVRAFAAHKYPTATLRSLALVDEGLCSAVQRGISSIPSVAAALSFLLGDRTAASVLVHDVDFASADEHRERQVWDVGIRWARAAIAIVEISIQAQASFSPRRLWGSGLTAEAVRQLAASKMLPINVGRKNSLDVRSALIRTVVRKLRLGPSRITPSHVREASRRRVQGKFARVDMEVAESVIDDLEQCGMRGIRRGLRKSLVPPVAAQARSVAVSIGAMADLSPAEVDAVAVWLGAKSCDNGTSLLSSAQRPQSDRIHETRQGLPLPGDIFSVPRSKRALPDDDAGRPAAPQPPPRHIPRVPGSNSVNPDPVHIRIAVPTNRVAPTAIAQAAPLRSSSKDMPVFLGTPASAPVHASRNDDDDVQRVRSSPRHGPVSSDLRELAAMEGEDVAHEREQLLRQAREDGIRMNNLVSGRKHVQDTDGRRGTIMMRLGEDPAAPWRDLDTGVIAGPAGPGVFTQEPVLTMKTACDDDAIRDPRGRGAGCADTSGADHEGPPGEVDDDAIEDWDASAEESPL